jgi:hypothetical protein
MAITPTNQVLHATSRPFPREAPPRAEPRKADLPPEARPAPPEPRRAPEPKRVEAADSARESTQAEDRRAPPPKPRGTFVDLKV